MKRGRHDWHDNRSHDELRAAVRHVKRRKWFRRLVGILGIAFLGYASLVAWLLIVDAPSRLPEEIKSSGDIGLIRAYLDGDTTVVSKFGRQNESKGTNDLRNRQPASILKAMAERWVALINQANPDAILQYDVDIFGNLYLYPGYWYYQLSTQDQLKAVDQLGRYWRSYLFEVVGDWRTETNDQGEQFVPGVILLDANSNEVAHNINGHVRVLRQPML